MKRKVTQTRSNFFTLKRVFFVLVLVFVLGWIATPGVLSLRSSQPSHSALMLAQKNQPQAVEFIKFENVSPHFIKAVLFTEDDLFFEHSGFNWQALWEALKTNLEKKKYAVGASTITQQVAKNLFLSTDKTLFRKLQEAWITLKLEALLSKKRILELYVNYAEMGPGIYGIGQASRYHFHKKPSQLNQIESSLLAGMLINGRIYGRKPYPARTYQRQKKILYRLKNYALSYPKDLFAKSHKPLPDKDADISNLIRDVSRKDADELWENESLDSSEVFLDEE